jgi:hypothetical protein
MQYNTRIGASHFPGKNGGERIQAAIDSLDTKPQVIDVGSQGPDPDGRWVLTKAIILPSNTMLIFHGSRLFLADNVLDNILRSFHAETGDDERDENIHIFGLGSNRGAGHGIRRC